MILDKTLTNDKLKEEAAAIEKTVLESGDVDESTKSILESFPPEFKDLILETVLKQIVDNPELADKFKQDIYRKTHGVKFLILFFILTYH